MNAPKPLINVCLLQPAGYIHSLALLEAAEYVVEKSIDAGYAARLSKNRLLPTGLNVVFGAHINPKEQSEFPANTVIFNTEQLPENSAWINSYYKNILQRYFVWDYSPVNAASIDHDRKRLVSFYHAERLNRIVTNPEPEYDLVFYGWVNERRKPILDRLGASGLKLLTGFNLYGAERDALLGKARAVLNLHFYDAQIFQQIRAFYPLTNGIPVISENFPRDSAPAIYGEVIFVPDAEPIEHYVKRLLNDRSQFKSEAARRIDLFRATEKNGEFSVALEQTINHVLGNNPLGKARSQPPTRINLGGGRNYRTGHLNIDVNPDLRPDVLLDLAGRLEFPVSVDSPVFGKITLEHNRFDEITAIEVLERVNNLQQLMTNCLHLLKEGGKFIIQVPYDLALGAWRNPTNVRAFNEDSWLYYTDRFWHMGWFDHRFECDLIDIIPSELGRGMIARNVPQQELLRTPRAIDSMKVVLSKRKTTPEEKTVARAYDNDFLIGTDRRDGAETRNRVKQ